MEQNSTDLCYPSTEETHCWGADLSGTILPLASILELGGWRDTGEEKNGRTTTEQFPSIKNECFSIYPEGLIPNSEPKPNQTLLLLLNRPPASGSPGSYRPTYL